ncbi:hypothetical protein PIB30_077119 [Stylosanthes scabra]|uniref:Uncharacterized protein n=1 Tax=Stylosanthes scabra TaxID=79078 RepID=A0ABU6WQA2_9FABA|nr:hypothetical protein [Stylosanthes scabra]
MFSGVDDMEEPEEHTSRRCRFWAVRLSPELEQRRETVVAVSRSQAERAGHIRVVTVSETTVDSPPRRRRASVVFRRFAEKEGEEKFIAESPREMRNVGVVAGTGVDSGGGDTAEGEKAGFESEGLMEGEPSREIESGGCCCVVFEFRVF